MDTTLLLVIGIIAIALIFDVTNGFHDAANSTATIVATRVLKPRFAVLWAAFFNFVAFLFFGTAVANTIGQTVRPETSGIPVIFAALIGAITWNLLTWWLGLPSSSSHALVGGLVGAGLAAGGLAAIKWSSVLQVAIFIVASPLVGFAIAAAIMALVRLLERRTGANDSSRTFKGLQLVSSAAVSLGHGSNDAQKTMGVIAALLVSVGYLEGGDGKLTIPLWVVLSAHTAIAIGTLTGGWNIVRTIGTKITELRPASGFSSETGAAIALFGSTALGVPVSTTHTVAGAVTGVGIGSGQRVSWSVARRMVIAWVLTLPAAALVAAAVYGITMLPAVVSIPVLIVLGVIAVVLFAIAYRGAAKPSDISRELDERAAPAPAAA